jgi:hypothetical protein
LGQTLAKFFKHIPNPITLILTFFVVGLLTISIPAERTLGSNVRLVILHGAWVWVGMLAFAASAVAGLVGLIGRKLTWERSSEALARTGLVFWLTYLPMSLLVMQLTWGGLFFDEPRWRIPFAFGVAALLMQIGLTLLDKPVITCAANLVFGIALWISLRVAPYVLHPTAPIIQSGVSIRIQAYFIMLILLLALAAAQIVRLLYLRRSNR